MTSEESSPNYLKVLKRHIQDIGGVRKGEVRLVTIRHDDWCLVFEGKECNCAPDVISRDMSESQE